VTGEIKHERGEEVVAKNEGVTAPLEHNATRAATAMSFVVLAFFTVDTRSAAVRPGKSGTTGLLFLIVFPDLTDEVTKSLIDIDALLG